MPRSTGKRRTVKSMRITLKPPFLEECYVEEILTTRFSSEGIPYQKWEPYNERKHGKRTTTPAGYHRATGKSRKK